MYHPRRKPISTIPNPVAVIRHEDQVVEVKEDELVPFLKDFERRGYEIKKVSREEPHFVEEVNDSEYKIKYERRLPPYCGGLPVKTMGATPTPTWEKYHVTGTNLLNNQNLISWSIPMMSYSTFGGMVRSMGKRSLPFLVPQGLSAYHVALTPAYSYSNHIINEVSYPVTSKPCEFCSPIILQTSLYNLNPGIVYLTNNIILLILDTDVGYFETAGIGDEKGIESLVYDGEKVVKADILGAISATERSVGYLAIPGPRPRIDSRLFVVGARSGPREVTVLDNNISTLMKYDTPTIRVYIYHERMVQVDTSFLPGDSGGPVYIPE